MLVLGVVSFLGMTTDLLPSLELPYIIVVTTYPGASPEKVEASVTRPLESVLGTTSGVKNISSVSSENSSMIILEFEQGTNMDSATIELSGNVDLVSCLLYTSGNPQRRLRRVTRPAPVQQSAPPWLLTRAGRCIWFSMLARHCGACARVRTQRARCAVQAA